MQLCPHCETDNSPDATVCSYCGEALPAEASVSGTAAAKDLAEEIAEMLTAGKKVEAIKRYRDATNCSLMEAKEAIEALAKKHGIPSGSGCGSSVVLILLLVACGITLFLSG